MKINRTLVALAMPLALSGCIKNGQIDVASEMQVGVTVLQAATLDEKQVVKAASLSAQQLDGNSKVAPPGSAYDQRLRYITRNLTQVDGVKLNYKVYLDKNINAFAMADGTVRVHSGLLDAMPDDQVLAVIGHEIGHVKLKHSYEQMRKQLYTNAAFKAAASSDALGNMTSSQLGAVAYKAVNARFSQTDELSADTYAVQLLERLGQDPRAMRRSIETLQRRYGSGGGFLSSHPSNPDRLRNIDSQVAR